MRESKFRFVLDNKLIDIHLQKGFIPKVSGTFEHTNQMAGIINNARLKQRQVVVTLLDLKNAFGEVNHNLIISALDYHHVSPAMQGLVKDLYTNFSISMSTLKILKHHLFESGKVCCKEIVRVLYSSTYASILLLNT